MAVSCALHAHAHCCLECRPRTTAFWSALSGTRPSTATAITSRQGPRWCTCVSCRIAIVQSQCQLSSCGHSPLHCWLQQLLPCGCACWSSSWPCFVPSPAHTALCALAGPALRSSRALDVHPSDQCVQRASQRAAPAGCRWPRAAGQGSPAAAQAAASSSSASIRPIQRGLGERRCAVRALALLQHCLQAAPSCHAVHHQPSSWPLQSSWAPTACVCRPCQAK